VVPALVIEPWLVPVRPFPLVAAVVFAEPPLLDDPSLIAPVDSPLFVVLASGAVLLPGVVVVLCANAAEDAARPNTKTLVANKRDILTPELFGGDTAAAYPQIGQ
jgi:hypothetical protein